MATPALPHSRRWVELDGIRCFAVLGVLATHFAPSSLGGPWGDWGVRVFFVLSGFLITHGLLGARARQQSLRSGSALELGRFFFRRAARLWPVYFAVIAVTAAFHVELAQAMLPWNLTFTTNYFITLSEHWPGIHSHLWTLAVEQQFYLFWPFVILLAPGRSALAIIALLIGTAPLLRIGELRMLAAMGGAESVPSGLLLPLCGDALAWGALLAFLLRFRPELLKNSARISGPLSLLLLGGAYLQFQMGSSPQISPVGFAFAGSLIALSAFLLINHCISGPDSPIRSLLRWRPIAYLGMISYGIYLLHNFMHWFGAGLLRRIGGMSYFPNEATQAIYLTTLSIGFAALSWHFFESPILRLSRRVWPLPA